MGYFYFGKVFFCDLDRDGNAYENCINFFTGYGHGECLAKIGRRKISASCPCKKVKHDNRKICGGTFKSLPRYNDNPGNETGNKAANSSDNARPGCTFPAPDKRTVQ
jgi:hypothetical protein